MSIKIILADDHHIMREGLCTLLEKQDDMEIIAQADDGRTAVRLTRELYPDVVVMDIAMPGLNGIEATRQITTEMPEINVIALSMHPDRQFVAEMLKAGAMGYLLKSCAFQELADAIRTVADNRTYLSPKISDVVIDDYVKRLSIDQISTDSPLSPREREVLQLVAEGKSTKELALELSVSVKTVETHRQQIMKKLKTHSVAELTKYAIREGLTSLEL